MITFMIRADEVEMKGRRKVRTNKWEIKEHVIKEARAILASRSVTDGRFLNIEAQSTVEEPIGILAGTRGALASSTSDADKRNGSEFKDM